MLLVALPSSWRPFVTTQSNTVNLTLPLLISKIMQEEVMRNPSEDSDAKVPGSALATTMFSRGHGRGSTASSPTPRATQPFLSSRGRGFRNKRRFPGRGRTQSLQNTPGSSSSSVRGPNLQLFTAVLQRAPALQAYSLVTSSKHDQEVWFFDTGATQQHRV